MKANEGGKEDEKEGRKEGRKIGKWKIEIMKVRERGK